MRREVEERAGLHAVDIYGLSEVMGPGVASECVETKDGLHVWEDHFYPEVVDPETGEVLPDGEEGELVFTSLTKEAHAGRPLPHPRPHPAAARAPPARCGGIEKITGRSDDMIILRGVNVFPTQVEELLLRVRACRRTTSWCSRRPHRLDEMTVRVEARPDCAADERARLVGPAVRAGQGERRGDAWRATSSSPGRSQRSEGKAVRGRSTCAALSPATSGAAARRAPGRRARPRPAAGRAAPPGRYQSTRLLTMPNSSRVTSARVEVGAQVALVDRGRAPGRSAGGRTRAGARSAHRSASVLPRTRSSSVT